MKLWCFIFGHKPQAMVLVYPIINCMRCTMVTFQPWNEHLSTRRWWIPREFVIGLQK